MKLLHLPIRNAMALSLGLLVMALWGVVALASNQMPRIWFDDATGYAISGYDPVDYFVQGKPVRPNRGVEAAWGGGYWKFRNVGNRGAFLAHPDIYAPRFGGMDPFLLAKKQAVQGNPILFDVYDNHLYLFYSGVSLLNWKGGREKYLERAVQAWPKAAADLGFNSDKWIDTEALKTKSVKPGNKDAFLFPLPK